MSTLNEEILRLKNAKAAIDEVLIARGVTIPENATLDTYNELINSVQGGTSSEEVTATKANVLAGTTTITADSNDEIVEGTMPNNSGQAKGTDNVYFDDSYMHVTVKYPGYYDENSTIRIGKSNLGNATADKVLEGTTYSGSEGLNLSGNIPIKSADTYFASTNDLTIDAGQYLGGTQTIKGLAQTNFSPANIKTGVTVKINNGDRDLFSATGTFCNDATLASAANLLTGNIAYGKDGTKYTGSMPNNGAVAPSALGAGGSYTIPAGYHNGSGKVTVQSLATLTASGDATAAQILSGKKAYVDGSLITGSMTDQGAKTSSLNCGGSYTIPAGYHNGSGKVTANSLANQTKVDSGKTAVAAAQMLTGYQGWVNGSKISGNMTNNGAKTATYTPSTAVQSYTIPAGYHNGSGKITINAIPSKYVDFSAGITFFEDGASESAMFTALGTCNQKPQAGIPVSEWKTTWAYKFDEVSWTNALGIRFICDKDENDQIDTQHGFCTKKSMDFTGIKTLRIDFNSNTSGSIYRLFFYNVNTYTIVNKDVTYAMLTGKDYVDVDISSVTGQCLWGMYAVLGSSGYTGGTLKYIKFYA